MSNSGERKAIDRAQRRVRAYIRRNTADTKYSRGLAYEGYMGGYLQALSDVGLVLVGVTPNRHPEFWCDESYLDAALNAEGKNDETDG